MNFKILILEDNPHKLNKIKEVLLPFNDSIDIDHFESVDNGAEAIKNNPQYDLMILDISLPLSSGGKIVKYGGVNFLNSICKRQDIKRLKEIIGLTQHKDVFTKANPTFEKNLIFLIRYKLNDSNWEQQMSNRISYLLNDNSNEEKPNNLVNSFFDLCKKNKIIAVLVIIAILIISFGDLIEKSKSIISIFESDKIESTTPKSKEVKSDSKIKDSTNTQTLTKNSIE